MKKKFLATAVSLACLVPAAVACSESEDAANKAGEAGSSVVGEAKDSVAAGQSDSAQSDDDDADDADDATETDDADDDADDATETDDADDDADDAAENSAENAQTKVDDKKALSIALKDAGIKEADATEKEAEKDSQNGKVIWEVSFKSGGQEYDYDIDAETGDILNKENEKGKLG